MPRPTGKSNTPLPHVESLAWTISSGFGTMAWVNSMSSVRDNRLRCPRSFTPISANEMPFLPARAVRPDRWV